MQNFHDSRNTLREDDGGDYRKSGSKTLSKTTIPKTRTTTSLKVDHSKDKELINTGLQKLVSTFNANKIGRVSSKTLSDRKIGRVLSSESELPKSELNSHIGLTKQMSIDKYTMTDFEDNNERPLDVESTLLTQRPYRFRRDLQWTDPRLLKKYQLFRQPYKKSLTIPYVTKSEYGSEIVEELSEDEVELIYTAENKHFLFKCLYYFCTTSVSFIGSMCGITLITVVLWKLLDENLLIFNVEPPRHETFLRRILKGVTHMVFELLNNVLGKTMRFLTMPTSEAFSAEDEMRRSTWYRQLF